MAAAVAHGGDVARFANLGFSEDDRYFLFAQYGVDGEALRPYCELFLVDVPANRFVTGGVEKKSYDVRVEPGDTGAGALYTILAENRGLVEKHRISHLNRGRIIYLYVNGEEPQPSLNFRDFQSGNSYRMNLVQQKYGAQETLESSYYIDLHVTDPSGRVRRETVGLPGYRRAGVDSYRIRQVIAAPRGDSLVIVVEKAELDSGGFNIRFMVETINLDP
jgi:predicted secreted protein